MRYLINILIALLVFELAGCAATGPLFKQAETPKSGEALIYIYRPGNFVIGGRDAYFYIDNSNVADLSSEGYTTLYIKPGDYELEQKWPIDMIGFDSLKLPLSIEENKTYYFRFYAEGGNSCPYGKICYRWSLKQVSEKNAISELSMCRYQPAK